MCLRMHILPIRAYTRITDRVCSVLEMCTPVYAAQIMDVTIFAILVISLTPLHTSTDTYSVADKLVLLLYTVKCGDQ
jgi:hypothetical protein